MELSDRLINVGRSTPTSQLAAILSKGRWLPAGLVLISMATWGQQTNPAIRLALSTIVLYVAFKVAATLKQRHLWSEVSVEGWVWYWTVWPGMRLTGFTKQATRAELSWLRRGIGGVVLGSAVLATTAYTSPNDQIAGWLTVVGLITLVHFGYADVLSWLLRRRGFQTTRLFMKPEQSKTLNEFWSKRWNLAFVEMDLLLFMRPLRKISKRWAPLLMLVVSGLLHELALSYPAGGGWGLPMIYFVIHGIGMHLERMSWFRRLDDRIKPWWTRILVLAPVGLVFHQPFRDAVPLQLLHLLQEML